LTSPTIWASSVLPVTAAAGPTARPDHRRLARMARPRTIGRRRVAGRVVIGESPRAMDDSAYLRNIADGPRNDTQKEMPTGGVR
jgi:hypothetical protein